jgi:prepilin-type N-terminal cleavage/methylation domain-containing protein
VRVSRQGDNGFTLVELVVALTVLALGIGAVGNTFWTSFSIAGQGNNRSRAVALATREAEAMRSSPYDRLGFSAVQSGFESSFEGLTTVLVADPMVHPLGPDHVVGGMTFQFQRHVVWADAASVPGYQQAYKRISVMVTWTDQGGAHQVRQDAFVYPGGMGVYRGPQGGAATSTTSTTAVVNVPPAPPLNLTATVPVGDVGATSIDLAWTPSTITSPAVSAWVVQMSTDNFLTAHLLTDTQPASMPALEATGLSPSTTYWFRVAAKSAAGQQSTWSVVAMATTNGQTVAPCQLGTSTITPSAVKRLNGGSTVLSANAVVSVNATGGSCSGLQLRFNASGGTTSTVYLTAGVGGVWTGVLNGLTTAWDTGARDLEVRDGGNHVLGELTFTVCVHNAKKCP